MFSNFYKKIVSKISIIGFNAEDTSEKRARINLLLGGYAIGISAALMFSIIYFIYNEKQATFVLLLFTFIAFIGLFRFHILRNFKILRFTVLFMFIALPFVSSLLVGGIYVSSNILSWTLLSPLMASLTSNKKKNIWIAIFFIGIFVSVLIEPYLVSANNLPENVRNIIFLMNTFGTTTVLFYTLNYFVNHKNIAYLLLAEEEKKSDELLLNILPADIANKLKTDKSLIAEYYPSASVLFADLVGFTPLTEKMAPQEMIELLNRVFSYFDALTEKYGLEKIRTIGDNYMVASGVPIPREDHAKAIANMALDIIAYTKDISLKRGEEINFRVGINSGPMTGGVIGIKKFQYDVWGDTVNIASRMESQGEAGKIQITDNTYQFIKNDFTFIERLGVNIKGKGNMKTYFLINKNI